MIREDKYIVLKLEDVNKYLSTETAFMLMQICSHIQYMRKENNKNPDKKYVVVSEDWPMYEDTWKAIEKWVDNND